RRHTRSKRDWSSDVCSSDLVSYALHTSVHIIPAGANVTLINSFAARIVGVVLIGIGLIIMFWAFISFGDSWRIGIDSETPGRLRSEERRVGKEWRYRRAPAS